jgi:2-polyprenyl-6-methoxyphenol hydroxylase-like FAD-dependent oxidoreductase
MTDTQVIICGAGSGVALAIDLARRNVECA